VRVAAGVVARLRGEYDRAVPLAEGVLLAERYVGAYQDRDLEAMLAVLDENVVSYPVALFGHRPHFGHAGVREWWAAMEASQNRFDVVVIQIRQIESDRVVVLGELSGGDPPQVLSLWGLQVRVRNGLIIESRSYLSDEDLLEEMGLTSETPW
jgi:ketosteroid isomerase-like protein